MPRLNDGGFLGAKEREHLRQLHSTLGYFDGYLYRVHKKRNADLRKKLTRSGEFLRTCLSDLALIAAFRWDATVVRKGMWETVQADIALIDAQDLRVLWHQLLPQSVKEQILRFGLVGREIADALIYEPPPEIVPPDAIFELLHNSVSSFKFKDEPLERKRHTAELALSEIATELAELREEGHSFMPGEGFVVSPPGIVVDSLPPCLARPLRRFRALDERVPVSPIELPLQSGPRRLPLYVPLASYALQTLADGTERTYREIHKEVARRVEEDLLEFAQLNFGNELLGEGLELVRQRLQARFWAPITSRRRRRRPRRGGYSSALSSALKALCEIGYVNKVGKRYRITALLQDLVRRAGLIFTLRAATLEIPGVRVKL